MPRWLAALTADAAGAPLCAGNDRHRCRAVHRGHTDLADALFQGERGTRTRAVALRSMSRTMTNVPLFLVYLRSATSSCSR